MFKRMLCLLLALLVLTPVLPASADESSTDILTLEELRQWVNDYKIRAMANRPSEDHSTSQTERGYELVFDFGMLCLDTPEVTPDSVVRELVITSPEETGLRGVSVDYPVQMVLDAYYSENPDLVGNRDEALVYAFDLMPEGGYIATLHRDGQRIQVIDYAVHEQPSTGGDGYMNAGIAYTIQDGNVIAIRAYGLDARIPAEEVSAKLEAARALGEEASYSRVELSYDGSLLEPFGREDMIFAGMDFAELTPEDAVEAFGEPLEDVWADDENGQMRIMQFAGCQIVFTYDAMRQNGAVRNMAIETGLMEGPRSIRVGDTFASIYNRFRHGEGEYDGQSEVLYGAEESGEYGMAEYGDGYMNLRYGAVTEEGVPVMLLLTFEQQYLSEILLSVNE